MVPLKYILSAKSNTLRLIKGFNPPESRTMNYGNIPGGTTNLLHVYSILQTQWRLEKLKVAFRLGLLKKSKVHSLWTIAYMNTIESPIGTLNIIDLLSSRRINCKTKLDFLNLLISNELFKIHLKRTSPNQAFMAELIHIRAHHQSQICRCWK